MEKKKELRVFLVDDDQLFLEALKFFLSEPNPNFQITIHSFDTGEACLDQIGLKPDVIVLDYYLNSSKPDAMDGIAVLKMIKQINPEARVIMLSSQDSITIASEMLEHGAFDYVSKNESAFVRIKNIITNISKTNDTLSKINKEVSIYKKVNIIAIIVIILLFIISRIYSYYSQ